MHVQFSSYRTGQTLSPKVPVQAQPPLFAGGPDFVMLGDRNFLGEYPVGTRNTLEGTPSAAVFHAVDYLLPKDGGLRNPYAYQRNGQPKLLGGLKGAII